MNTDESRQTRKSVATCGGNYSYGRSGCNFGQMRFWTIVHSYSCSNNDPWDCGVWVCCSTKKYFASNVRNTGPEICREKRLLQDYSCLLDGLYSSRLFITAISLAAFFIGGRELFWEIWLTLLAGAVALVISLIIRNEILIGRMISHYLRESHSSN